MTLETAHLCLGMAKACGVQTVVLIGGEPTLYPALFEILSYVHNRRMRAIIVTNGIRFAEPNFTERLAEVLGPNDVINISVKGTSDSDYFPISMNGTKSEFDSVCQCLIKLSEYRINHAISYVVSQGNAPLLKSTLVKIRQMSNANIGLSLCGPCFEHGGFAGSVKLSEASELAATTLKIVANSGLERISVHVNTPLCFLESEELNHDARFSFSCHVLNRSGLVFDTNGDLLLCNHLLGLPVGQFGEDYSNTDEFMQFIRSNAYSAAWTALTQLPFAKCSTCKRLYVCRGGCPLRYY